MATTSLLVGRNDELAALRALLEGALDRKRHLVFVTGEAGIGKTALVDAVLEHADGEYEAGKDLALSTDYPDAGRAIL